MTIGIDVDDTICDSFETLFPIICKECNLDSTLLRKENINYEYFFKDKDSILFEKATKILRETVNDIPLKKDVSKHIMTLHKLGHKIIFITARSTKTFTDPYEVTKTYLINNGIYFDDLIVSTYDKDVLCKKLGIDLFIDDSINHNKSISALGIDTLLFDASYNRHSNDFKRVSSWEDIITYITTNS